MAFSFAKTRSSTTVTTKQTLSSSANQIGANNGSSSNNNNSISLPPSKLTSSQLNKTAKLLYPAWLKDYSSCSKQLPGVYHGVLGQVQLQPTLVMSDSNKFTTGLEKLVRQHQKTDYFNRLTDTERVHQLLSTSRLSNEHLATIWAHVNQTFPGQLTNREVCLALALIAIFQQLDKDGLLDETIATKSNTKGDPFALVKLEKKPPVPILYPNEASHRLAGATVSSRLPSSNSMPNDLGALLIDITSDDDAAIDRQPCELAHRSPGHSALGGGELPVSLMDGDLQTRMVDLAKLRGVWLRFMGALKGVFKRSFDILNVENSRASALEALGSSEGLAFCKNLCLCYPIAHNVAFKIDELNKFQQQARGLRAPLLDKNYVKQINDLMVSINEYWAVLINLLHEAGLTSFIELLMDGLNRDNKTLESDTPEGLLLELDTLNKADLCSLCHTKFYLVNIGDALDRRIACLEADVELVLSNELISNDLNDGSGEDEFTFQYFYHAKCANFWLNNVPDNEGGQLPYRREASAALGRGGGPILKPQTSNTVQ